MHGPSQDVLIIAQYPPFRVCLSALLQARQGAEPLQGDSLDGDPLPWGLFPGLLRNQRSRMVETIFKRRTIRNPRCLDALVVRRLSASDFLWGIPWLQEGHAVYTSHDLNST